MVYLYFKACLKEASRLHNGVHAIFEEIYQNTKVASLSPANIAFNLHFENVHF